MSAGDGLEKDYYLVCISGKLQPSSLMERYYYFTTSNDPQPEAFSISLDEIPGKPARIYLQLDLIPSSIIQRAIDVVRKREAMRGGYPGDGERIDCFERI